MRIRCKNEIQGRTGPAAEIAPAFDSIEADAKATFLVLRPAQLCCEPVRLPAAEMRRISLFRLVVSVSKNSFRTRASETGSMTGWGVTSLVQIISTTQFFKTSEAVTDAKYLVSARIFAGLILPFGLCRDLGPTGPLFGPWSPCLKIPFLAAGSRSRVWALARRNFGAEGDPAWATTGTIAD